MIPNRLPMRLFLLTGLAVVSGTSHLAYGQALLQAGHYVETPPHGAILWVGRSVLLRSDSTFAYWQSSDDLGSSHYGTGTYRANGRQLRLLFTASVPRVAQVREQLLPSRSDSLSLSFLIQVSDTSRGSGIEGVPFATVTIHGVNGQALATAIADVAGRATLRVAYQQQPQLLRIASLGMQTWQQAAPTTSTTYRVRLLPDQGMPYPAGEVKVLQLQPQPNRRLALRTEDSAYPLLLQPNK